ncbi:hypothetical protein [Luteimicrobium sp. DT211]|uniref:hypothetical protein n=1 Tax=Luteimicrobium sp. DT211 TaxID=3393412 RepID=UPI003CFA7E55
MRTVLLDDVIRTDDGQLDLTWSLGGGFDGDRQRFFAAPSGHPGCSRSVRVRG